MANADEVGNMVALMLSDRGNAGGWLTGSDVVFDGGECFFATSCNFGDESRMGMKLTEIPLFYALRFSLFPAWVLLRLWHRI